MAKYTVTFEAEDDEDETPEDVIKLATNVLEDEAFTNVQCVKVVG